MYMHSTKQALAAETQIKQGVRRVGNGAKTCLRSIYGILALAGAAVPPALLLFLLWVPSDTFLSMAANTLGLVLAVILWLVCIVGVFWLFGGPLCAGSVQANLCRVGFVNAADEAPTLISRRPSATNPRVLVHIFFSCGLPLSTWQAHSEEIQAALNLTIVAIQQGENQQHILLYAVPGSYQLPGMLPWQAAFMQKQDGVVAVGEALTGLVTIDFNSYPHLLIGGSTGSGKTYLLQLILWQLVQQGAQVFIADFKGALDYTDKAWSRHCRVVVTLDELLSLLDKTVEELYARVDIFKAAHARNIMAYRALSGNDLSRIVIAIDEVAEVLDKTGVAKAEKEQILRAEAMLSTIARQGRALGIHLLLATQRPDAQILSGQIKNNLYARLCGRTPDVELKRIILGDTAGAAQPAPTVMGRFVNQDGITFQAFYFSGEV